MNPPFYFRPENEVAFTIPHLSFVPSLLRNRKMDIAIPFNQIADEFIQIRIFACFYDENRIMEIHFETIPKTIKPKQPTTETTEEDRKFRFLYFRITRLPKNVDLVLLKVNEPPKSTECSSHSNGLKWERLFLNDSFDHSYPQAKFRYQKRKFQFKSVPFFKVPRNSSFSSNFFLKWIVSAIYYILMIPKTHNIQDPRNENQAEIDSCTIPPK